MITLIVPSFNRTAQLYLLLESLRENIPSGFFDVHVVYKASNTDFAAGYRIVKENFPEVNFVYEDDLHSDMMRIAESSQSSFLSFSTDDMIVYRKWPSTVSPETFLPPSPAYTSSLRLGLNTTVQDHHKGLNQPVLTIFARKGEIIEWDSSLYHPLTNYGYPLSFDLHVFAKSKILDLASRFAWRNSNELEGGLQKYRSEIRYIRSFRESLAFNCPSNNLSGYTATGDKYIYDVETLNETLLEGLKIDLAAISRNSIVGCHQNVEFSFIPY